MDFSNLKKIFYIVAIISMLLSIKSKVFASDNVSINDFPTIPEVYENQNFIIAKNYYSTRYFLFILNSTINENDNVRVDNVLPGTINFPSGSGKVYRTNIDNGTTWEFFENIESTNHIDRFGEYISEILISSVDIYDPSGTNITFQKNFSTVIAPFFDNVSEIENGNPDGVYISPVDYSRNDNLYFHLLEITTGLSNSDNSIYYYNDKTFILNKDSDYFRTWADPNIDGFYYYIPRYKLGLAQNTSYLYVLNNSKNTIDNSYGLYTKDIPNGIYDVVQSDTAGVITATEEESDRMKNIEETLVNNQNSMDNIQNTLTDSNVTEDTQTDIDSSLSFDNSAPDFSNLYGSFFSRLSSTISELGDYDLSTVESINIPIPFTNKQLIINSDIISSHLPQILTTLFNTFWLFIFGKYFLAYILYIYRQIASGHILEGISSNNEVITNDVL